MPIQISNSQYYSCTHTDCPTFWVSIIGTFFNHWWILQAPKERAIRGLWGNVTPQNFEILMVWNPISIIQRGQFLSRMSLKLIICKLDAYLCLHHQALCTSTWSYFIIFCALSFKVFWISVSVNYTLLGVLVSSIVRIHCFEKCQNRDVAGDDPNKQTNKKRNFEGCVAAG